MMPQNEKVPLLSQPSFTPHFLDSKPPPYGVVEISPSGITNVTVQNQRRRGSGFTTTPAVAIIAVGVAMVLLFGAALITPADFEKRDRQGVLKQSSAVASEESGYKDITIPQGNLRGFTLKSRQGRDYTAYYKVPYAEPPVGDLRLMDPVAPRSTWSGLRAISVPAPQCIQKEKYTDAIRAVGEEDCLYANIFVPNVTPPLGESFPVMVYIHGGGFTDGNSSRYGAEYFMDEDVVLVLFHYRLGSMGFLSTGDDVIRGNQGLKDQVQMLRWTKDNIQHFNGDPNRVTIFGESAGAFSVSLVVLSPMANGLFHRAITQSGANVCTSITGQVNTNPRGTVEEVGRVLNCSTADSQQFLNCLRTKSASEITLVRTPPTKYVVCVENRTDDQVFLPDLPYNVLKSNPNRVPQLIGVVNAEALDQSLDLLENADMVRDLNGDFGGLADKMMQMQDVGVEELLNVKKFYFGDKDIGNDTMLETAQMMSDRFFAHCTYVSAKMHAEFSPTYLYHFNRLPGKSYASRNRKNFDAKKYGLMDHGDELQFEFPYNGYPYIPLNDPEHYEFSRDFIKLWVKFAANGAPPSDWEPVSVTADQTFWYEMKDVPARTEVMEARMDLWDQFSHKQLKYEK